LGQIQAGFRPLMNAAAQLDRILDHAARFADQVGIH
jgi:hypothetical protein